MSIRSRNLGFTLVELMIAVAILTIIAGIAIPAYNGYIREARISAAAANIEPLRIALEDYWLDNATYGTRNPEVWVPGGANSLLTGDLAWQPDPGDKNMFSYSVTSNANSYSISVTHIALPNNTQVFNKVLP
ncbi:MAG: prepilin-type N-terminal cleavage/methylation domain-containing protein [Gammaproteobacteria bacterium]|nr:prepilin-type N-terminal cleavage/methylation domain-containing protein [Gammaproteobacteria bacterium]MCB1905284.1 prepilin-type N-terminal cleavage/methylation domain-containing protein [Gammaproteobacteria bacterium]